MPSPVELGGGVAVATVLASASIASALLRLSLQFRARRAPRAQARAHPKHSFRGLVLWQATLAGFLWLLFRLHFWTPASVGFTSRESPSVAFLAGLLLYGALLTTYSVALRTLGVRDQQSRAALRNMARWLPKDRLGRCAVVATICLANPLTEELVYRGLLVHQWALLAGDAWSAIAFGALVNALNHAYQGWRAAPFHLLFYCVAVGLLYSPYGMSAVLGLHFLGDALPFLTFRERLGEYRRSRKRARRLKSAVLVR